MKKLLKMNINLILYTKKQKYEEESDEMILNLSQGDKI